MPYKKTRKASVKRGGGQPGHVAAHGFSQNASHHLLVNNPIVSSSVPAYASESVRSGALPPMTGHGLPGVSPSIFQKGGRYGFLGGEYVHIPCEQSNSTIPASGASGTLNMQGSELWTSQKGGAQVFSPAGVPESMIPPNEASGSTRMTAYETVPTASYTNLPPGFPTVSYPSGVLMVTEPVHRQAGGARRKSKSKAKKSSKKAKKTRGKRAHPKK